MKFTHVILMIGTAALATACTDSADKACDDTAGGTCDTSGDTDAPTDTDVADVTPTFNTGAWAGGWHDSVDCTEAGKVTIGVETNNQAGKVALYMTQTTVYGEFVAWDEEHTLDEDSASTTNDGDGFSILSRTLTTGASLADQASDTSTLWVCGNVDPSLDPSAAKLQVSFAMAVWAKGASGSDAPTDCIYYGQDPDEMINDGYTGGTGTDGSGRTLPIWLKASDCTKL